jgi:Skp family chaperone for outer membrane proteins
MARIERVVLYVTAVVCLAIVLGVRGVDGTAIASQDTASSSQKMATVDVLALVQETLQSDTFRPERESVAEEWTRRLDAAQAELQRLQEEIQLLPQNDPQQGPLRQQYQRLAQQAQQIGQQANQAYQEMSARQAREAYAKVHSAADKVAASQGFGVVFATRTDATIDESSNLATVTQEILARPVLFGPATTDLTGMVRTELGLPEPGAEEAEAMEEEAGASGG